MKKQIWAALMCAAMVVSAQTARFPATVAGDGDLKPAVNNLTTQLRASMTASDTVILVADAARIRPHMLLTIGKEVVSVVSVDGNRLTVQRAFDGTSAAPHASGSTVAAYWTAWHHNAVAAEVKAIQSALGPNLSNLGAATVVSPERYNFSRVRGVDVTALTDMRVPGTHVLQITNCPAGLNFSPPGEYVWISGGEGTPEAAEIVPGGSCATNVPSGTIIIQTTAAHDGAWQLSSMSDGIQEAIHVVYPNRGTVVLQSRPGGYTIRRNGVRLWNYVTLACEVVPTLKHRDGWQANWPNQSEKDGCVIQHPDGAGVEYGETIRAYSNSTIDGIAFYNPSQPDAQIDTPTIFPPVIRVYGNGVILRNLYTANAFFFIDATVPHDRLQIRNILGQPIYRGIVIDRAPDSDLIEDVEFTTIWNDHSVLPVPVPGPSLQRWSQEHGIALFFYRADNVVIRRFVANGYRVMIQMDGSHVQGSFGTMSDIYSDNNRFTIVCVNACTPGTGWFLTNSGIGGHAQYDNTSDNAALVAEPGGNFTLSNTVIAQLASHTGSMIRLIGDAKLRLSNVDIFQWAAGNAPIYLSGAADLQASNVHFWKYGLSLAAHVYYAPGFTGRPARFDNCQFDGAPFAEVGGRSIVTDSYDSTGAIDRPGTVGTMMATGDEIVASAPTITPTGALFYVSGNATISTINVPPGLESGSVCAIPSGAWQTDTGGNIAVATQAVIGKVVCWFMPRGGTKWYPSN